MLSGVEGRPPLAPPSKKGFVVSFQSRQKKRRYKRIEAKSRQARRAPETARRWFLTLAKKPGRCSRCGDGFERGAEIVYRHEPREVRCLRCAGRDPEIRFRPSIRWERARRSEAA
jgi:hypothetical protein